MAQLTADCFAHGGTLTSLQDALLLLDERMEIVAGVETVPLAAALGRILAEDLIAAFPVPPRANSAVDGYAVRFEDLSPEGPTTLAVVGRAAAGHPEQNGLRSGEAVRIFTGAIMPEGADTVLMQEDCRIQGDRVTMPPGIKRGANRRRAGEDVEAGAVAVAGGVRLRPQEIGMAASLGFASLPVRTRLKAALFSTGDELMEPGQHFTPGCIYDSNRYTLAALLAGLGVTVADLGILPDREPVIREALRRASEEHDLIVTSGGVSVGEEDHVKSAVQALGSLHFWRLAIKPGRPIALGQVGRIPFIGLPGNPVAAMVTFLRVVRPLILKLAGARDRQPPLYRVQSDFMYRKKTGRREWVRVSLVTDSAGSMRACKFPREGAGILASMVASDGLAELPEDLTHLEPGAMVDVLPFAGML
ncbi:MAG TPA: gephyrin-like molybdotransferase Glp [Alphaproteobacteria bacterium]|nr:gephyrin-like molybdotransferase Glp [Alphaproteobacteria bacterium]